MQDPELHRGRVSKPVPVDKGYLVYKTTIKTHEEKKKIDAKRKRQRQARKTNR